jgi:hypothetical protein
LSIIIEASYGNAGNYPEFWVMPGAGPGGWGRVLDKLESSGGGGFGVGGKSKSPELLRDFDMFCFIEEIETISFLQPS